MTDVLSPEQAEQALRTKIRDAGLNRCRILSDWKGAPCDCGLCLIDILTDRNTSDLVALRARCAALEAENGRLKRAVVCGMDEYHRGLNDRTGYPVCADCRTTFIGAGGVPDDQR